MTDQSASAPARTLGEALRREREMTGSNQGEIAELLGTTQSTYSRWESDSQLPRKPEDLYRLARHLGMADIRDLLLLAYMPGEDAPDEVVEERLREVELAIAHTDPDVANGEGGKSHQMMLRATLARVRKIEAMFEEVAGNNGRLHRLEEMLGELREMQETIDSTQRVMRDLARKVDAVCAHLQPGA